MPKPHEEKLDTKIKKLQEFYQREKALVTSPFISQDLVLNKELLSRVLQQLDFDIEGNVLDIGCGTGLLSTFFDSVDFYCGIDLNNHPGYQVLLDDEHRFLQGNALHLPFATEQFDLAICMDSFEHFPDPIAAAKEIYRVLKPQSSLFLSVPTYANVAGLVKKWAERYGSYENNSWAPFDFWKPQELEHFITPARVKDIFTRAGFKRFDMIGFDKEMVVGLFPWIWHPRMPGKLAAAMSKSCNLFAGPVVSIWPHSSLHTFWKLTKLDNTR